MRIISPKYPCVLFLCVTLIGCGPNEAEIRAKVEQEVFAKTAAIEAERQAKEAQKKELEGKLATLNDDITDLKTTLIRAKSNLEVARDQMSRIKEWQFGRTQSERDYQIQSQSETILNIENSISEIQSQIMLKENEMNGLHKDLAILTN